MIAACLKNLKIRASSHDRGRNVFLGAAGIPPRHNTNTGRTRMEMKTATFTKHILPNSINPILTTISSWFASLLTGAFFVEYVFNYKRLGMLTITAINQFDIPVVIGCCIITVIIFVFVNIITDILYGFFDPRISNN